MMTVSYHPVQGIEGTLCENVRPKCQIVKYLKTKPILSTLKSSHFSLKLVKLLLHKNHQNVNMTVLKTASIITTQSVRNMSTPYRYIVKTSCYLLDDSLPYFSMSRTGVK
jgi:hypothetical protein